MRSLERVFYGVSGRADGEGPPDTPQHAAPATSERERRTLAPRGRCGMPTPGKPPMPCVARHRITREKRVWRDRHTCDRWFHHGDSALNQADWDINDDEPVPYWGTGMMHPGPDGRDPNGPVYDTPNFKPADHAPTDRRADAS